MIIHARHLIRELKAARAKELAIGERPDRPTRWATDNRDCAAGTRRVARRAAVNKATGSLEPLRYPFIAAARDVGLNHPPPGAALGRRHADDGANDPA